MAGFLAARTGHLTNMVDSCFNSACKKELRYLREGRVVRVVGKNPDRLEIQHYWLCGECYKSYDFVFGSDGTVTLGARFHIFVHADDQRRTDSLVAA